MDSQPPPLSSKQTTHKEGGSLTIHNLPPEICQAIWQANQDLGKETIANDFHATYDKIEALEVSSESRTLTLKDYKLCFGKDMRHPIYFNGNRDFLKFTSLTLAEITYYSTGDVWNTDRVRAANIKRIVVKMPNDFNVLTHPSVICEPVLLCCATLLFATLETIFVQPSFVMNQHSEATFRARFERGMQGIQEKNKYSGPLRDGEPYNIPEIVFVCSQCDPDFLKAYQC
ncbi:uncharacterized protein EAE97_011907 [Botrytis byssoidea]|uniref:2EXR domain-containing protein n=1 Tax=Botrytis byssoidea TaxID=139641 RepID=A0A9P5HYR3_9HELO|nr:uncharacterized protein EAE97_011907 [Botrytis byssoidea]KAF7918136.1 hypothetical protein EAE97_011907 [Botrytis byssoidea]